MAEPSPANLAIEGKSTAEGAGRAAVRVVVLFVFGWACFVFHGLSFHLTPWSQAFTNAIFKHVYPKEGQGQTTVLLFREENLQQLKAVYPVPYSVHAQIIEALTAYNPRALFVDFAFIDRRSGESGDDLAQALCTLARSGTKIFLAAVIAAPGERGDDSPLSLPKGASACWRSAIPDMDEAYGVSGVLTYPSGRGTGNELVPSAAFALAVEQGLVPADKVRNLEIVWGKGVDSLNRKWMKCEDPSLLKVIEATLLHGPLATKVVCPYSRTITVNHLLNSSGDADVRMAIEGKTLFYGAAFRLTGDRFDSPVYAEMPGVYLHAMAYDNLATFGGNYKRAEPDGPWPWILDVLLLLAAASLLVWIPREDPKIRRPRDLLYRRVVGPSLIVAFFLLGVWLDGLDGAVLVLFALYVLYRWLFVKDWGFVAQVALILGATAIAYWGFNLGPRNIVAYIVFFEVVRILQEKLKKWAAEYHDVNKKESSKQSSGGSPNAVERPLTPLEAKVWAGLGKFLKLFHQPQQHNSSRATGDGHGE